MLRVFIGVDHRQPIAYHVLSHSILTRSSQPVAITPLWLPSMPIKRRGLTEFTFSRFLVPHLCGYEGRALFLDADMLVAADIAGLFDAAPDNAVSVVPVEPAFERAAVMHFNCGHTKARDLTPERIEADTELFKLKWAGDVGSLPPEWHHVVGYQPTPAETPALIHYTQGVPCHEETAASPYADLWQKEARAMNHTVSWAELMGNSVHAARVMIPAVVPKFMAEKMVAKKEQAA